MYYVNFTSMINSLVGDHQVAVVEVDEGQTCLGPILIESLWKISH